MDLGWVALAVGDIAWISLAFTLGFLAKKAGLPPLVGFLATGFILNTQASTNVELFQKLADIGITLLLFTIGLKINVRQLVKPHVWALSGLHMLIIVFVFGLIFSGMAFLGISVFSGLNLSSSFVVAFALSFSSTVFVVKVLEEKGELKSLHGGISIGILIMQDIVAVMFLAFSTSKIPSIWAVSLLLLFPLKFVIYYVLKKVGHSELLVLYGFILAMGGAEIFELVGMKGDLGALIFGMLIASQPKADDLAKSMLGFKDLFLLGFFISIGLSGHITTEILLVAVFITPLIFIKTALFFFLLIGFKLRARTSLFSSIHLGNYSEFGLIVAAIAAGNNWINNDWLIIIAIAMSLSFIISAIINSKLNAWFSQNKQNLRKLQHKILIENDDLLDVGEATVMIIGMGTIGTGAYDRMRSVYGNKVIGVDIDTAIVNALDQTGRSIIHGDPSDADFWDRIQENHVIELVMLTLPKFVSTLTVIEQLKTVGYKGQIAATTKYQEEQARLSEEGIMTVANIYTEAGSGFANHVVRTINKGRLL